MVSPESVMCGPLLQMKVSCLKQTLAHTRSPHLLKDSQRSALEIMGKNNSECMEY